MWPVRDKKTRQSRHALLHDRVEQGEQVGLLGYLDERPVSWCGAWAVEAYPVLPDSPRYRFMGLVEMFERAGFEHRGLACTRRHVMSRRLSR